MIARLAIHGGEPVARRAWPRWPAPGRRALRELAQVLHSGRWTISTPYRGRESVEQRFAHAFAAYCGAEHCVPTATGTASLSIALEACGVGAGDEVIVPGLSWVASASAVLGVGAVPVLVDVDPGSFCLDPAAAEAAITDRTRAISVVHVYSAIAEVAALAAIADRHGIPLVEDCAHAHGARYRGRSVGLSGSAGTFSMQGSKLLTSGEGGALITRDAGIARRAEHLRADGRVLSREPVGTGDMELVETAEVMGANACLSEFHAAVLLDQLELLEAHNEVRRRAADHLDDRLTGLGCTVQSTAPGTTARTYYRYAVRVPGELLAIAPLDRIAEALTAELGFPVQRTYRPLNDNPLHRPSSRRRFAADASYLERVEPSRFPLPVTRLVHDSTLTFGHEVLLSDVDGAEHIARAFEKVVANVRLLGE
ncbi:DegT/DnrJ/EryC1/StrS family aminotransferase [Saccharopolyspora sp. NPDC000359]|uniref:DegT/DnrJ/EryC1/StrS aminotransferase family protein n=1 Tax=Saccharopolyspora sp. NPDC000359 TaxID=3154251 RepID=UPI0033297CD4